MDHEQFQEWLSGIEQLSAAQRQAAEAVFAGGPASVSFTGGY